jgi:hypothetical protein
MQQNGPSLGEQAEAVEVCVSGQLKHTNTKFLRIVTCSRARLNCLGGVPIMVL